MFPFQFNNLIMAPLYLASGLIVHGSVRCICPAC